jgi:multicomponent Na+:H+ antiporter subunit D
MSQQFPAFVVISPLLASFIIAISTWVNRRVHFPVAVTALAISLFSSIFLLMEVMEKGPIVYLMGGWAPPWGIVLSIDHLSTIMLVLVSGIGFLNLIASRDVIERDFPDKVSLFYTLYLLSVVGHLGIVATGDVFNLYVLIEIAALSGYSLLALGEKRAPLSSLNYLIVGSIGASLYLLGIGYLYIMTGSLNMMDISGILRGMYGSPSVLAAFGIAMVGIWVKMAFFPLHAWLPNAYTHASTAASGLLAPLTTKVMVYVMVRMIVTVFSPEFSYSHVIFSTGVVWLAAVAIVVGGLYALAQRDLKRMLVYILISEVGYMAGGAFIGNREALTGTILHIINDSLMTFCVFLALSNIVYKVRGYAFEDIKGLFSRMPVTMGAFVIGGVSMIGVPPTCGFFSKWYLLWGAFSGGHPEFGAALILSSLINVVLFFRVFEICFFESAASGHSHGHHGAVMDEAPLHMLIPLILVASSLIGVGLYTGDIVTQIISLVIPASFL